ncbi:thioredoxin domain-containing protein [Robertmurraya kyonggiensis]|uniref:thioredoxin domain-containing protein n=1 Tax=Robertmurraya kyonggiensis TaxID=1037680 RepID=UPI001FE628AE|nr:thioredoxin domain-containing protein [Robertmurraya kyonggiensis]
MENRQISFGKQDAPVKVEVFLNLACPYCASYFGIAEDVLPEYIANGQVEYIIKHYDKPREMLLIGTLVNTFLDYKNPERVREIMKELFETQNQWDVLNNHEIKNLLTEKYQLKEEPDNIEESLKITAEAIRRNVKMVPTVFINEKEFQYPREIGGAELRSEIEAALAY